MILKWSFYNKQIINMKEKDKAIENYYIFLANSSLCMENNQEKPLEMLAKSSYKPDLTPQHAYVAYLIYHRINLRKS